MTDDFEDTGTQLYSQFIHKSRYARWVDKEGRRETWDETVSRFVDFFKARVSSDIVDYDEIYNAIYNIDVMPSMRALMTAGPALEACNVAGYNCLAGETLVTTKEFGIVPIKTLAGKSVHVIDGNGDWVLAKCSSYGLQPLMNVTLSGKNKVTIRATPGHRWSVLDADRKSITADLEVGTKLNSATVPVFSVDESSSDYFDGVVHGLVYGDGTAQYKMSSGQEQKSLVVRQQCKGFSIRICSDASSLLPYFGSLPVSYPPSYNGDPVVYLFDRAVDQKALPDVSSGFFTDEYLVGFLRGWLAADGTVSKTSQVSIASTADGVAWLYTNGPKYGFVPAYKDQYPNVTNLGTRNVPLYRVSLERRSLDNSAFIVPRKRERFSRPVAISKSVTEVSDISEELEEVFCFEVPTTQSFLLTNNILTGNCAYLAIDHQRAFDEMMYILMCGTGVGYSVERQYVAKLPDVSETFFKSDTIISVPDSRKGWCKSFKELISLLYSGLIPTWDLSNLRPAGARLKTFGGRSSGPKPLDDLFHFTVNLFQRAKGRKLTSLECHDLCCKIAEIVVVGGVRRSALISLSNPSDDRMRQAKSGQWWLDEGQRALANNSACYTEKPDFTVFLKEWNSLYKSKSGERGFFSRAAADRKVASLGGRRQTGYEWGCNPCSEIILRMMQFCNLSEVIIRSTDTLADLERKVRIATIIGTLQSTLTDFKYLRSAWKKNCEEERLLGVSLTGIQDHPILGDPDSKVGSEWRKKLRLLTQQVNAELADALGIPHSAAITTVKPSGTVSQLTNAASGIHARFSQYYVRRVRADMKDPLAQFMSANGFPWEVDVTNPNVIVFEFPIKSPEGSKVVADVTALKQLELWKLYQDEWCDHKPSCTVYYTDNEFLEVGSWLWNNFNDVSGVSFLPKSDHIYKQAPYEEINEEKYNSLLATLPTNIDWTALAQIEKEDHTTGANTLACAAGVCEVVDLTS